MKKVIISKFHNGVSDTETNSTTFNKDLGNFDIYEDINKLMPIPTLSQATMNGENAGKYKISNFFRANITGSGEKTYAFGTFSDTDTKATLYAEDIIQGQFNKKVNLNTSFIENANNYTLYNGIPYLVTEGSGTTYYLNTFTNESTATQIATINAATRGKPQMFNNPIDGRLYIAIGKQVFVWGGTTMITGLTLPNEITSICAYSSYLAIATTNGKENYVYIWSRDTSLTTVTQLLDFGTGRLEILENINGILFGVSYENYILTIRNWSGGEVQIFKSIKTSSLSGSTNLLNIKKKIDNKLYFATSSNNSLWCLYKNKAGNFTLTKSIFTNNSLESSIVYGFDFVETKLYINSRTLGQAESKVLYQANNSLYTNTSYYITTENTGITDEDIAKTKVLKRFYVNYKVLQTFLSNPPIVRLFVSLDGGDWIKVLEEEKSLGIYTIDGVNDITGATLDPFIQIKFKVEVERNYAEILEIGYIYETTNRTNI